MGTSWVCFPANSTATRGGEFPAISADSHERRKWLRPRGGKKMRKPQTRMDAIKQFNCELEGLNVHRVLTVGTDGSAAYIYVSLS